MHVLILFTEYQAVRLFLYESVWCSFKWKFTLVNSKSLLNLRTYFLYVKKTVFFGSFEPLMKTQSTIAPDPSLYSHADFNSTQ